MKSLGNLLRKYISENGLTIYKAASLAGVNRTTLQKVLSDERNASEELIQKLLSVLKLSPAEKAELKELFAIQLMGEDIYLQRQYIKKSIESIYLASKRLSLKTQAHIRHLNITTHL